ncbi:MAG: type 1 glutamine amidotransferase [Phycisphaerales bacterium]|nr:type 1 glutamine amidotransferase [Phycisphaerales bacterium]
MALLVLEHSAISGSKRLGATLRDHGHRLHIVSTYANDPLPPDLNDVDGIISMGGPQALRDHPDFLDAECALIREAHEREMPVLGICLGCQILAHALGGTVDRMDANIELGFHDVELNNFGREDALFTGIPWTTKQFAWHRDEVKELPAGAKLLASSRDCKVQAWTAGLRTYGIQYHPEIYPETAEDWIRADKGEMADAKLTPDDVRTQLETYYNDFARHAERLFESVAMLLMPVDRRYQGQLKDLHH